MCGMAHDLCCVAGRAGLGWPGGVAGAQLEEVCRDGMFLVGSGQEQSKTQVLHSPCLGKSSEAGGG